MDNNNNVIIKDSELNLFHPEPNRIIVCGASGSGKTHFVSRLIRKYENSFNKIVLCNPNPAVLSREFKQLLASGGVKYAYHRGVYNPWRSDGVTIHPEHRILIVLDDLMTDVVNDKTACDLFTRGRHSGISIVLIAQNLFMGGKYSRHISLNTLGFALFNMRDTNQVGILARQIFGNKSCEAEEVEKVYKHWVKNGEGRFRYLYIDLREFDNNKESYLRLRTNVLASGRNGDYPITFGIPCSRGNV